MQARKHEHITPILHTLHWLPIQARIEYKISNLCHNYFSGTSPHYLSCCLTVYIPTRTLRSTSDDRISDIPLSRAKLGDRLFSCSAPKIWNSLPHVVLEIFPPQFPSREH